MNGNIFDFDIYSLKDILDEQAGVCSMMMPGLQKLVSDQDNYCGDQSQDVSGRFAVKKQKIDQPDSDIGIIKYFNEEMPDYFDRFAKVQYGQEINNTILPPVFDQHINKRNFKLALKQKQQSEKLAEMKVKSGLLQEKPNGHLSSTNDLSIHIETEEWFNEEIEPNFRKVKSILKTT